VSDLHSNFGPHQLSRVVLGRSVGSIPGIVKNDETKPWGFPGQPDLVYPARISEEVLHIDFFRPFIKISQEDLDAPIDFTSVS